MSYTCILIHVVFATKNRDKNLILNHREDLFRYIKGTIKNLNCKPLAVNGQADHVHILFDLNPSLSISDFVKTIKIASNKFIKEQHIFWDFKGWQEGYFAGSVSPNGKKRCIDYINDQGVHHKGKSFLAEMEWLKLKYEIENSIKNSTPGTGLENMEG